MRGNGTVRSVFGMPAAIAVASLVGLISALVGDGVFDALSWVAFASIVGIVVRKLMFPMASR